MTTSAIGDEVVSIYSSVAIPPIGSLSGGESTTGSAPPATAFEGSIDEYSGATTAQTGSTSSSSNWIGETVALSATTGGCYGHCSYGLEDPGGVGTYYTNVINEARVIVHGRRPVRRNERDHPPQRRRRDRQLWEPAPPRMAPMSVSKRSQPR